MKVKPVSEPFSGSADAYRLQVYEFPQQQRLYETRIAFQLAVSSRLYEQTVLLIAEAHERSEKRITLFH